MNRSTRFALALALVAATATGCASATPEAEQGTPTTGDDTLFSQDLHDSLPDTVRESGTLRLVGDVNAPWRLVDTDGVSVIGFQSDLMEVFEEVLGVEIITEMTTGIPAVKLGVQSGRFDAAFGPLLDTPETEKDLSFIVYTSTRPAFTFASGTTSIESAADLCGTSIAHVDGSVPVERAIDTINEICTEEGLDDAEPLPLADASATLVAVESGRADSAAMGIGSAAYAKTTQPDRFDFYMGSEDEFATDYNGMAIDPANTELIDALLGAWQVAFDEGIYEELMTQHGMEPAMVDAPSVNPATS